TNHKRVFAPPCSSKRTLYPTVSPRRSPRSSATRRAAIRAAKRRGSRTITSPRISERSKSAGGTRVVFPAPGGASMTSAELLRSSARISGMTSSIGSADVVTIVSTTPARSLLRFQRGRKFSNRRVLIGPHGKSCECVEVERREKSAPRHLGVAALRLSAMDDELSILEQPHLRDF